MKKRENEKLVAYSRALQASCLMMIISSPFAILDYSFPCAATMSTVAASVSAPSTGHITFSLLTSQAKWLCSVLCCLFSASVSAAASAFSVWLMLSTDFGQAGTRERYEMSSWCHLASTYKKKDEKKLQLTWGQGQQRQQRWLMCSLPLKTRRQPS